MKEHPIPQDITGYRFHIVGSMTIKQFAEIGAGFVIAAIIYKIGFPPYIKYPLMVLSAGVGAAMAFLPIEERPLDHWIITFFQVMFRPTQFYWRRSAVIPSYFLFQPSQNLTPIEDVDLTPARRERIHQFISSLNEKGGEQNGEEITDQARLSNILDAFGDPSLNQLLPTTSHPTTAKPNLVVRVRQLREDKETNQDFSSNTSSSQKQPDKIAEDHPSIDVTNPDLTTNNQLTNDQLIDHQLMNEASQTFVQFNNLPPNSQPNPTPSINIPATELTFVTRTNAVDQVPPPPPTMDVTETEVAPPATPIILSSPTQSPIRDVVTAQSGVQFNTNLPFPSTPTEPNKLVGMVLSAQGDMVPGAIIEVVDQNDNLARAVKSNALGQFFITTPLITGTYIIKVDKDDLSFSPQELTVDNSILQPIELRANA